MSSTVALIAILVSFLGGVAYVVLELVPQLRSAEGKGAVSYAHYYELAAAPIFVIAQGIAALFLWRGDPAFLFWILPPAAYLSLIGVICWYRFGRRDMLALDTCRGLVLVLLSFLAWSQLLVDAVAV